MTLESDTRVRHSREHSIQIALRDHSENMSEHTHVEMLFLNNIDYSFQVFYSQSAYQFNSIKTINTGKEYHNANYKQGWHWDQMTEFMLKNLNTDMTENPVIQMFYKIVHIFKKGVGSDFGSMKLDYGKFNLSKKALQPFGKYFEPELLKFFNMCGSILQTQCRWWDSGLLYGKLSQSTLDTKIDCASPRLHNSCV